MKTIKTNNKKYTQVFLLLLAFTLAPIMSNAQSIFEKYEDMNEVSTVVVTKKAFELLGRVSSDSPEVKEYKEMVSGLNNLTVYTTEDSKIAANMKLDVAKYLKKSKLAELMRVKDKDSNVKIYILEGKDKDHVKELFISVSSLKKVKIDGETPKIVILSLTGDIDLNNVSKIADKMNIPGGEQLKKVHRK